MFLQINYILRSKVDGRYLVARINGGEDNAPESYLLVFQETFEALSYLNTHASDVSDRFVVESASNPQLKSILQRWNFQGFGLVKDPLIPQIEFLSV
ncbi:MAG: hypothetical protein QNJ64_20285 [Crocosphaera sp.]|nr:hypothetical protein [Crocosphaera sp.]